MGAKKNANVSTCFCRSVFFLWPPNKNGVISVGGPTKKKKKTTTELLTPFEALYKTCL